MTLLGSKVNPSVEGNNAFSLAMYQALRKHSENLFLSPFSVRTALLMCYAGARSETALQMADALRVSPENASHQDNAAAIQALNATANDNLEISIANSLWTQEGMELRPDFLQQIHRVYEGSWHRANFQGDVEAARAAINDWVETQTQQKVRDLIPHGAMRPLTRLVLANAVYFKGQWRWPFHEFLTREQPFFAESGSRAMAPLMNLKARVPYYETKGFQALELNYQGDDLTMFVLLPKDHDGLAEVEASLSARLIEQCRRNMDDHEVQIFLPRIKITWGTQDLSLALQSMGMTLAFDRDRADFSGMNDESAPSANALCLSSVFHKAFVDVNEQGTEAAASTAAVIELALTPFPFRERRIPVFRADHPFLFAIVDRSTGMILFLGRIANPMA